MSDDTFVIQKLDDMGRDITDIKVILAKQETHLAEHIKRSDLLEEKVSILREEVYKSKGIKDFMLFIVKISSLPAAIIALIAALKKIL